MAKAIYCANNNTKYKSATDAANALNVAKDLVSKAANGSILHAKYYVFRYINEDDPKFLDLPALRRQMLYDAFKIKI